MVLGENREYKIVRETSYDEVVERIGEKRTLLYNILSRNPNCILHILTNCLLDGEIQGQMSEGEGIGRRRT